MAQFYLRIERLTQNRYSGDPESPVRPDQIDHEKNLHVYLSGEISEERSVVLRAVRQNVNVGFSKHVGVDDGETQQTQYKASLPHYTLSARSEYLLKSLDDYSEPWAIASIEIRTL